MSRQGDTAADLAGVRGIVDALQRIEAGSERPEDFDAVGERWDIHAQLHQALSAMTLEHLEAATPAARLSGGEAMRVALAGAFVSGADWLILDEPSNHLDHARRRDLIEQLRRWRGGLVVVSHDRRLLESMARIIELSDLGLRSYGGGYSLYADIKAQERALAIDKLDRRKAERRREVQELTPQRERLHRRQSRGPTAAAKTKPQAILDRKSTRLNSSH